MVAVAEGIVKLLIAYVAIGIAFAVSFVTVGIRKVDAQASESGAGFRLIILPGVAALWPLLLTRWVRGVRSCQRGLRS